MEVNGWDGYKNIKDTSLEVLGRNLLDGAVIDNKRVALGKIRTRSQPPKRAVQTIF